jgi:hypothetical protein
MNNDLNDHERTVLGQFGNSGHARNGRAVIGRARGDLGVGTPKILQVLASLCTLGFFRKRGSRYVRTGKEVKE